MSVHTIYEYRAMKAHSNIQLFGPLKDALGGNHFVDDGNPKHGVLKSSVTAARNFI